MKINHFLVYSVKNTDIPLTVTYHNVAKSPKVTTIHIIYIASHNTILINILTYYFYINHRNLDYIPF
ncbi:unknown [Bacteroides clarus CAG:160]|nr:unknown [Bacteroides clarus CAG:160]